MTDWTTPTDIRRRMRRLWDSGRLLSCALTGENIFPHQIPLKKPSLREMGERFGEVRQWIDALAKDGEKSGYTLEWREINHRQLGRNRVPVAALFADHAKALQYLRKQSERDAFLVLCGVIKNSFPALGEWLATKPFQVLEQAADWPRLLDVIAWVCANPRSDIYVRQLEISGADTKFIENHKALLSELLEILLPASTNPGPAHGAAGFEERYGFSRKPAQVRFRLLDRRLCINGLSDLSIPIRDFAGLNPPVERIYITENEINGLAFPDVPGGLVIFGLGYGLDRLAEAHWLRDKPVYYWGDIDTHGFAMLDRMRAYFPQTLSFLMDRGTLVAHRSSWVSEAKPAQRELKRLTPDELALYEDLRNNRLGPSVRLEQERVDFRLVKEAVQRHTQTIPH